MAITYNNLYLDIRRQLRSAGIEAATLEARELVCFGTGKSRQQLTADGSLYASPELEKRVRDLVERHLNGEPVAYQMCIRDSRKSEKSDGRPCGSRACGSDGCSTASCRCC